MQDWLSGCQRSSNTHQPTINAFITVGHRRAWGSQMAVIALEMVLTVSILLLMNASDRALSISKGL